MLANLNFFNLEAYCNINNIALPDLGFLIWLIGFIVYN